jgi:hypothetical protein
MAFTDGTRYGEILHAAHFEIAGFGGMFLAMVFTSFIVKKQKNTWLRPFELWLQRLGQLKSFGTVIGLFLVATIPMLAPESHRFSTQLAMLSGLIIFLFVDMLSDRIQDDDNKKIMKGVAHSGAASFLYLEVLDASFSFDGVIGAFALSTNVLIIMAGLGIGALFVRSMTVFLVRGGHLDELPHLGHAAHYAIGALAAVMFIGMKCPIPEVLIGLMGVGFITAGWVTSRAYNRRHTPATAACHLVW